MARASVRTLGGRTSVGAGWVALSLAAGTALGRRQDRDAFGTFTTTAHEPTVEERPRRRRPRTPSHRTSAPRRSRSSTTRSRHRRGQRGATCRTRARCIGYGRYRQRWRVRFPLFSMPRPRARRLRRHSSIPPMCPYGVRSGSRPVSISPWIERTHRFRITGRVFRDPYCRRSRVTSSSSRWTTRSSGSITCPVEDRRLRGRSDGPTWWAESDFRRPGRAGEVYVRGADSYTEIPRRNCRPSSSASRTAARRGGHRGERPLFYIPRSQRDGRRRPRVRLCAAIRPAPTRPRSFSRRRTLGLHTILVDDPGGMVIVRHSTSGGRRGRTDRLRRRERVDSRADRRRAPRPGVPARLCGLTRPGRGRGRALVAAVGMRSTASRSDAQAQCTACVPCGALCAPQGECRLAAPLGVPR